LTFWDFILINDKDRRATYDDAVTLAHYAGLEPATNGFKDFVKDAMQ
jgi:hypothetical protein